jgi:hypothetical protein
MFKIHHALHVVCAITLLACVGLSVPLLASADGPESCRDCPVAEPAALPSPGTQPPATRAAPAIPGHCLVGSWLTVDEGMPVKFYSDADPFWFTVKGRYYEFRPDGTGVERNDNVSFVGSYEGNQTRLVANGWREFRWSHTADSLSFLAITNAALTWSYYDQRGLVSIEPEVLNPARNEVKHFTCAGSQVVVTGDDGFRSMWARTADFGAYG